MKSKLLIFTLLLWIPFASIAQKSVDYDELDRYIAKAVEDFDLPGLAIGIVKGDSLIFAKGYGVSDVETKKPVTPNTVFAIASCSKAFTAACLGMMVEDKNLNWDDKVIDHFPEFQLNDPYVTSEITVRDLLCHRAGFETFDGDLIWYRAEYDRKEVIRRISKLPLKHGFRETFGYSNVMFLVAGEVMEKVTASTWDQYVKDYIFKPLGMTNSSTSVNELVMDGDVAMPHIYGDRIDIINWDNSGPAASINSSVVDLSKWVRMWLGNGTFNDYEMLKPSTVAELQSAQLSMHVGPNDAANGTHFKAYGLGWSLMDYSGAKVAHHSGGLPGYISKVAIVPEKDFGFIILTNDMTWLPGALTNKILDMHLNDSKQDWAGLYLPYYNKSKEGETKRWADLEAARDKDSSPSLKLDKYAGEFTDEMYGDAKVSMSGKELHLKLLPTKAFSGMLEHWHHDTFRIKFEDEFLPAGFVTFQFNSAGEVVGFLIDLPNPDLHFTNLEFKKK